MLIRHQQKIVLLRDWSPALIGKAISLPVLPLGSEAERIQAVLLDPSPQLLACQERVKTRCRELSDLRK